MLQTDLDTDTYTIPSMTITPPHTPSLERICWVLGRAREFLRVIENITDCKGFNPHAAHALLQDIDTVMMK